MTLADLLMDIEELLREQPQTADYEVVLVPHGHDHRQELATIHQQKTVVLLEARK